MDGWILALGRCLYSKRISLWTDLENEAWVSPDDADPCLIIVTFQVGHICQCYRRGALTRL